MKNTRSCTGLAVALAVVFLVIDTPRMAQQVQVVDSGMFFYKPDKNAVGAMGWRRIINLMNDNLIDAKQVNIYADLCHSGRLADFQQEQDTSLDMPYVIGTAAKLGEKAGVGFSNNNRTPPGRLPKRTSRDVVVDDAFYYGYSAFIAKHLRVDPAPSAKALHDAAAADRAQEPQLRYTQQYVAGNGGDGDLKLNAGDSTHDVVFNGDLANVSYELPYAMYFAAKSLSPTTLKYYSHGDAPGPFGDIDVTGPGTAASFESMLGTLKTALAANKDKQVVNLFLYGHGSKTTKNVEPKPNPMPNQPKQGKQVEPGSSFFNITMTPDIWSDLREEVTQDDPELVRAAAPDFYLSVSEAMASSPFEVKIGGLSLGSFSLGTITSGGGMITAPLSDSFLQDLIDQYDGVSQLPIEFTLAPGSSFRLALDEDITFDPSFTQPEAGTGLMTYVSSVVPEPAGMALLALNVVALTRRRPRGSTEGDSPSVSIDFPCA